MASEAEKISGAPWALRTGGRRRRILTDLAVQPVLLSALGFDPDCAEVGDCPLPPLTGAADAVQLHVYAAAVLVTRGVDGGLQMTAVLLGWTAGRRDGWRVSLGCGRCLGA